MAVKAAVLCVLLGVSVSLATQSLLPTNILDPSGFSLLGRSHNSSLYTINLPASSHAYTTPPLFVSLRGSRYQIGYDYAALLTNQTALSLTRFMDKVFPKPAEQKILLKFVDFLWDAYLRAQTPEEYLEELRGMAAHHTDCGSASISPELVSKRFFTLANMPADAVNIVSMLEQETEKKWPEWLKHSVNDVVKLLERLIKSCDAYGVWGSRTSGGLLHSSRNLDYNSDTGINEFKLVTMYSITDARTGGLLPGGAYATIGFALGTGALAGINTEGVTVSEMNLDNSEVTFDGLAFPLRLRAVLEQATDLRSAMTAWNNTNNTNSFNFLISSAADAAAGANAAVALETIKGFTAMFPADSPTERVATYDCVADPHCSGWTNQTGAAVRFGSPLQEAVWRTNHGYHPSILRTQESLFNGTMFRYNLLHDLIHGLATAGQLIDDKLAVGLVASLGTKGPNFLSCDQHFSGDNTMSIAYAPGPRPGSPAGAFYVAWESGTGQSWRPAACSDYVKVDLDRVLQLA